MIGKAVVSTFTQERWVVARGGVDTVMPMNIKGIFPREGVVEWLLFPLRG